MTDKKYKIICDPIYGYNRLDPIPDEQTLTDFYQNKYYELIRKGEIAQELRRFMSGDQAEIEKERQWLRSSLYADIQYVIQNHVKGKRVLDVGCGTAEFLSCLKGEGFEVVGVEPSQDAVEIGKSKQIEIHCSGFDQFIDYYQSNGLKSFDAVTLLNVLEHVANPVKVLNQAKMLLSEKGIICVKVPNDFNPFQLAAQKKRDKEPWWIGVPDHINYFNVASLRSLFEKIGFEIVYSQTDFPMELFLLMGENYVGQPNVGSQCHQKRVRFETSIPTEVRRSLYRSLGELGLGGTCLMFAMPK